jgi:hypothetical protein
MRFYVLKVSFFARQLFLFWTAAKKNRPAAIFFHSATIFSRTAAKINFMAGLLDDKEK